MDKNLKDKTNWLGGLQWFFFIFANIVIIPLTIGEAFHLSQDKVVATLQYSFVITGIACLFQAFFGHRRAIMEGQSGLWWGIILTLVTTSAAQGISLQELGGSLAVGIFISSIITMLIGLTGLGPMIAKWFNSGVMGTFMLLFGFTLINIFLKGMLGLPFGNQTSKIDLPIALLSFIIAIIVIIFNIKASANIRSYGLLIGIIIGWIAFVLIFGTNKNMGSASFSFTWFPLGHPTFNLGIITTAVITGLLNLANTFGALKGTDDMYEKETTRKQYRHSITISGFFTGIAGFLGVVPYAPFVSSIGFLKQTQIITKLPFIIGSIIFLLIGLIPPIGEFFSTIPLSIGSAVLFVVYLQLLNSSFDFFKKLKFNSLNIYRAAIPVFVGTVVMILPPETFSSIPSIIRPILSNGLLVGIILSLLLENIIQWDNIKE